jgi:hypothetical protein
MATFMPHTKSQARRLAVEISLLPPEKGPKPTFFDFLSSRFFFGGKGRSKARQKIARNNLTSPSALWAPEEPTNHVWVRNFVFEGPLPLDFRGPRPGLRAGLRMVPRPRPPRPTHTRRFFIFIYKQAAKEGSGPGRLRWWAKPGWSEDAKTRDPRGGRRPVYQGPTPVPRPGRWPGKGKARSDTERFAPA